MLVPIRCFTCGNLIGDKEEAFRQRIQGGEEPVRVLDDLGLPRYCCRRMLLANANMIDQVLPYLEALSARRAEFENHTL